MKIILQPTGLKKVATALLLAVGAAGTGIAAFYADKSDTPVIAKAAARDGSVIYENSFATQADFDKCTIVQGPDNPSGDKWKYYRYGPHATYSIYAIDKANPDCYLFFPVDNFDATKKYQITVEARTTTGSGNAYDSDIEFGFASEPTIEGYNAVNSLTVEFASVTSPYSSDVFAVNDDTKYGCIRVHYNFPSALTAGSLETIVSKITVAECEGGDDNTGDDDNAGDDAKEIFSTAFDSATDFATYTIEQGEQNPTASKWKLYSSSWSTEKYIYYDIYASDNAPADCYLFIPVDEFDASKNYQITIDALTDTGSGNSYDSEIEFGYASDASSATYTAVSTATIPYAREASTYTSKQFTVAEGTKYAVLRAHFEIPETAKGSISVKVFNMTITEATGSGEDDGDDDPADEDATDVYTSDFTSNAEFNTFTVLSGEGNPSGDKWKYNAPAWGDDRTQYVSYTIYKTDNSDANCYLFIPVDAFNSANKYQIAIEAFTTTGSGERYESAVEFGYASDVTAEAYTAVNSQTIEYGSAYAPYTSDKFSVKEGAKYAVIRAHYAFPALGKGSIETRISKIVVTEFAAAGEGDNNGDEDDDDNYTQGDALSLPYSIVPTDAQIEDIDVLDNNGDYVDHGTYETGVWSFDAAKEALVYLYSDQNLTADDYVFLPLLAFDNTETAYEISLDVMVASSRNPESFEICMGKTKEPADQQCFYKSANVVNDEDWETIKVPVGVDKKGNFYVSIHATSTKNGFKLFVKNISVTKLETSPNVPQAPAEITATAGEKGALKAEVAFTVPSLSIANRELSGDVTVTVKSSVDSKTVTAAAGETAKVEINTVQGDNNITLTAENSFGTGNTAVTTVYTGVDVPFAPEPTASVSEDNLTLTISWEQSEKGLNGGYVDPATVNYTIYRYDADQKDYDDGTVITGKTSYEFTCEAGTPQHRESFLVTARNVAGQAEGGNNVSGVIGAPYTLPMIEKLEKGKLTYNPLTVAAPDADYSQSADFRVYSLATIFETPDPNYEGIMDGHSSAIWGFIRYGNAGKCRFLFPKFTTDGVQETKFKLSAFINDIFPTVDIYATAYDAQPVKIGTIDASAGSGWTDMAFIIPEAFADCKWVLVYLDTEITDIDNQNVFIGEYSFSSQLASDMALEKLEGTDDALSVGDEEVYTAIVRNEGKTAAPAPSVKFTLLADNGDIVEEGTVNSAETLEPEQTAEYKFTVKATADNLGSLSLIAEIEASDENDDNNEASIDINIIRGLKPVVDDLDAVADASASTIRLTWSKPDIKLTGLDDFEDYEPFEYGKYIGNFKNLDLDGKKTYSFDQCVFDAATLPKAFMVINPDYLNNRLVLENYEPHSGKQYLVAFCPADGSKANDWLISPEVKPSTVVSYYITTVAPNDYSEEYEICYSSTTSDPADFKVLAKKTVSGIKWVAEAFMLPEDAKYFAIHYTSADVFGIMLDDIDYTPVINDKSEFKYNIYADDKLIDSNIDKTSYELSGVNKFDSHYNVTAVVDGKEYAKSNTAVPRMSTGISDVDASAKSIEIADHSVTISGYEGEAVAIYAVDGTVIYSTGDAADITTVTLSNGIYVVKAGNDVRKIAIN